MCNRPRYSSLSAAALNLPFRARECTICPPIWKKRRKTFGYDTFLCYLQRLINLGNKRHDLSQHLKPLRINNPPNEPSSARKMCSGMEKKKQNKNNKRETKELAKTKTNK